MKLKRWSQTLLAATASIGACMSLVSCGTSNTVDYLYALSAKNEMGQVNVYRVDSQSGALTQIPDSPFNAGRDPVSEVADGTGASLYVANNIDNSIIQYGIGTDAKLYGATTINPTGSGPVALAIHSYFDSTNTYQGSLLYVVETFQPNFSTLNTGPGALFVYRIPAGQPITTTAVTQTVNGVAQAFVPLGNTPTAVNATADGLHVFATDFLAAGQSGNGCTTGQGGVQAYNVAAAAAGATGAAALPSGVLTSVTGSPFCAGTTPTAIASHPYSTFLYVTDSSQNQVITYSINTSTTIPTPFGALANLPQGPVATGTFPDGIVVDPRGLYVYVANKNGGSVSGYGVNLATGALSALATGGTAATGAQPGCVIVEPALGRFLYTGNFVDNTVSGFNLDPNTGALSATQGAFYNTSGLTTCVAAVSHGNHPIIHVQNVAGS